ncbi:hypothetical protein ONZ45_g9483 [Pleurotus djamor]|nr:hypothetical protein ONZ45_g9483 [Pleurotus djamor]
MGQYFLMQVIGASLDKQQTTGHLGKWGEFGDDAGVSKWITAYDATKDCEEFLQTTHQTFRPRRATSISDLGDLSKLPPEMISRIFENMTSTTSIATMAASNSQLFVFAYPFLAKRAREYLSSWAYTRIICIGDNADKLPEGCVSADEWYHLQEMVDDGYERCEGSILYLAAQERFPRVSKEPFAKHPDTSHRPSWASREDTYRYKSLTSSWNMDDFIKEMASKVMINVTRKEYVKETDKVTFEYCLSPMIVWGYDDEEEERGPWAGDRLAIVSSEKFEAQVKDEAGEWVDVTTKAEARQEKFREWYN